MDQKAYNKFLYECPSKGQLVFPFTYLMRHKHVRTLSKGEYCNESNSLDSLIERTANEEAQYFVMKMV